MARKQKFTKTGKIKKPPKWNSNSAFRSALRRAFTHSPQIKAVMLAARKEEIKYNKDGSIAKKKAVFYQCAICKQWFKSAHVAVDHIDPVINPETGFVDWNTFIERLDCPEINLQVVCSYTKIHEDNTHQYGTYSCHTIKTQQERQVLKELRDSHINNN